MNESQEREAEEGKRGETEAVHAAWGDMESE
jgi:hypothetical protein